MSVQFLQVNMYFQNSPDEALLREKFNLAIDWLHYMPNCWFVKTTSDADAWYRRLKPLLGKGDYLFICKVDLSQRQGWLPADIWNWLGEAEKDTRTQRDVGSRQEAESYAPAMK